MAVLEMVSKLNKVFQEVQAYKRAHPETKTTFYTNNIGSLLNAYREGDVEFEECIALIQAACVGTGEIDFLCWAEMFLTAQTLNLKSLQDGFQKTRSELDKKRSILRNRREDLERERDGKQPPA